MLESRRSQGRKVYLRWWYRRDGAGSAVQPGALYHEIKNNKFVREWTTFDELDLLKQLHGPVAAAPAARVHA